MVILFVFIYSISEIKIDSFSLVLFTQALKREGSTIVESAELARSINKDRIFIDSLISFSFCNNRPIYSSRKHSSFWRIVNTRSVSSFLFGTRSSEHSFALHINNRKIVTVTHNQWDMIEETLLDNPLYTSPYKLQQLDYY